MHGVHMYSYMVEPLYVESGNEKIAADFYRPLDKKNPAVIIMAHGFAGLRQFKLIPFAQKFAQAGYAVVLFDYRYWGGSTGYPRELVSIRHQLEDWQNMIGYVTKQKDLNHKQVVLWGTGLSGGYVLKLAAELKHIYAVISQVPYLDGAETAKLFPIQQMPKALKLSSQDYMGAKIGLKPKRLPVVHPYALSFFPMKDGYSGYMSIVNPDYFWSGEVPARAFFHLIRFRPLEHTHNIQVPVLLIAAKHDHLTDIQLSREAATNIAPFVDYYEWDMAHFDIYHHAWLQNAISTQLKFLEQHIGVN